MTGARGTADRFRDLIHSRLLPGLAELGFGLRPPGALAATEAADVVWLLDLDIAPWSSPQKVCFTLAWGVDVPGMAEVVGDPPPEELTVDSCVVSGRLGERGHLEPRWFELRSFPRPVAAVSDQALANHVLGAARSDVLPVLAGLSTPVDVQHRLHGSLVTGRGAPSAEELRTVRRIAALSLLLGDRDNAARWLDHLEARSATAMAPDLVAERLAPLRERLAS